MFMLFTVLIKTQSDDNLKATRAFSFATYPWSYTSYDNTAI